MSEEEERKRRRKKEEERKKAKLLEELRQKQKRTLHMKHKERRKKDCMIGLPFLLGFGGDPAMPFYCNDVIDNGLHTYELIHDAKVCDWNGKVKYFYRLTKYQKHHIVSIGAKVLIFKAGDIHE